MELTDYVIGELNDLKSDNAKLKEENTMLKSFIYKHINFKLEKGELNCSVGYYNEHVKGNLKDFIVKTFGVEQEKEGE